MARTFTVNGVPDENRHDQSVTVSHQTACQDSKHVGIAVDSITVAVSDTMPGPE